MISQVIYGSRARGDHRHSSDVDLLGIMNGGPISRTSPWRGVNLHLMPFKHILKSSRAGDLFTLHIVEEGRVVFDPSGIFEMVKSEFRYKDSYCNEKKQALQILQLISQKNALESPDARKRFIWALRTLIISSAAENRRPIFGSAALESWSDLTGLKSIIDRRNVIEAQQLIAIASKASDKFGEGVEIPASSPETLASDMLSQGGISASTVLMICPEIAGGDSSPELLPYL